MTPDDARADWEHEAACQKALYAGLVREPFGVTMDRLARLTDRQISEIYGHKTDGKGTIEQPERPAFQAGTREQEKAAFFAACGSLGIPWEKAKEEWLAKRGPD